MTTLATAPEAEVRTCRELKALLGCRTDDDLARLLWQTHDLEVVVEDCPADDDPGGVLRLRVGDCGMVLGFPTSVAEFWAEVDALEACALEERLVA